MDIKNKVAIITGSSSNIGKATALLFAKAGAKVIINSNINITGGQEVVNHIANLGGEAIFVQADVSKEQDVLRLFDRTIDKFGTVDILINNAGVTLGQPFLETTVDIWQQAFANNLISAVLCSREAAKIMLKKEQGSIINTVSVRGIEHTGREGIMAYSAAKAGLINFTKTLAKELAPNIFVNAIAPGFVYTHNFAEMPQELVDSFINATLIKRFIQPEEIAESYLFLARSNIITGEVLVVDGGFTLKVA
ncbi:MAG: SDR family oxidoreductase [Anaerolineales bacterium]|jgi:3-oxoacyl-[acyl-carrier protein] reductase